MLRDRGHSVRLAPSGRVALMAVEARRPDLVLLDINMPEMDGWETLRLIKADDTTRHLPVVMFSVKGEVRDKVHGLQEGAADYLTKPFEVDDLLTRVRRVLGDAGVGTGSLPAGA
jgi:DNA-binding response OmpR family regulator